MKLFKTLAVGVVALALAGVASATTVKVTGSTAYRKALYGSIVNYLSGGGTVKAAFIGSAGGLAGANQAAFTNGTDTVIACMAGSVGGVNWIVNNSNVATIAPPPINTVAAFNASAAAAWIDPTVNGVGSWTAVALDGTGAPNSSSGTPLSAGSTTWLAASPADFTMSDSFQDSTPFDSASTGVTLDGESVGVVQFTFAKSKLPASETSGAYFDGWNRLTNVPALAFQNLAANGHAPLATFTGNSADTGIEVALVGRDADSGTRLATNFETGYGTVITSMKQYRPTGAGSVDAGTTAGTTITTIPAPVTGSSGYSGGGNVKNVLQSTIDTSTAKIAGKKVIFIGYVGVTDSPGNSQALTYNGGKLIDASAGLLPDPVKLGQYTFWTYEKANWRASVIGATKAGIAQSIADGIDAVVAAASGVSLNDMQASRAAEGQVVNPNY